MFFKKGIILKKILNLYRIYRYSEHDDVYSLEVMFIHSNTIIMGIAIYAHL